MSACPYCQQSIGDHTHCRNDLLARNRQARLKRAPAQPKRPRFKRGRGCQCHFVQSCLVSHDVVDRGRSEVRVPVGCVPPRRKGVRRHQLQRRDNTTAPDRALFVGALCRLLLNEDGYTILVNPSSGSAKLTSSGPTFGRTPLRSRSFHRQRARSSWCRARPVAGRYSMSAVGAAHF